MVKILTYVRVNVSSVDEYQEPIFYREKKCSNTHILHSHIGCRVYEMPHVKIRVKPFDSIKRQKKNIIFILDNYLSDDSIFHDICKDINIDYNAFLDKATTKKKPDRLRKYLTPLSTYS